MENKKKYLEVLKPNTQKITIKDSIRENTLSQDAKNKLNKIKEIKKTVNKENLFYRTNEYTYNHFQTINTFGRDICNGIITLKEADKGQSDLLVQIMNFRKQVKNTDKKQKKNDVL